MTRIIRALLALTAATLLAACSLVRLGYSNLPELTYLWLDGFFDLNEPQSTLLRQDLQTLHEWHRRQELPLLGNALARAQTEAAQPVTAAQLCGWVETLKPRVQAVLEQSEPALVRLAVGLTPEQFAHLKHQLDKRHQKWRDEWLKGTPQEQQARRVERLIDRAEDFYGTLSPAGRALLKASVATSPFDLNLAEAEMLRRQSDFLQTLQALSVAGVSPAQARSEVHQLLERTQNSPTAAYRANIAASTAASCNTFAALHNSSSAAQRNRLIARLKSFEDDARALALPAR